MDSTATLYESLFDVQVVLCERFRGLSPFEIRRERAGEVFNLLVRLKRHNEMKNQKSESNVIRKKAGDDWF